MEIFLFLPITLVMIYLIVENIIQTHRLKLQYKDLKIGDRYKILYYSQSPFEEDKVFNCIITNKKNYWVEYQYMGESKKHTKEWFDFILINKWKKVNN